MAGGPRRNPTLIEVISKTPPKMPPNLTGPTREIKVKQRDPGAASPAVPSSPPDRPESPGDGATGAGSAGHGQAPGADETAGRSQKPRIVLGSPARRPAPGPPEAQPAATTSPAPVPVRAEGVVAPRQDRMRQILWVAAIAVPLLFIAWALAWQLGEQRGKDTILNHMDQGSPVGPGVTDPTVSGAGEQASRGQGDEQDGAMRPERTPRNGSQPGSGDASRLPGDQTAAPAVPQPVTEWRPGEEFRTAGWNYLYLARLPWSQAFPAAVYLTDNGIPAAAVPARSDVDPVQARDNNLDHFVVLLEGVEGGSAWSRSAERRAELEAAVRRIGAMWKTQAPGNDDFTNTQWTKFRG